MKKFSTLLLLGLLLLSTLSKTCIVLSFQLNQDFIQKYLCENRNQPQSPCGGQCVLSKRLAAEAAKGEALRTILEKLEIPFYNFFPLETASLPFLKGRDDLPGEHYASFVPCLFIADIFHPPRPGFVI